MADNEAEALRQTDRMRLRAFFADDTEAAAPLTLTSPRATGVVTK